MGGYNPLQWQWNGYSKTNDSFILIGAGNDNQFKILCKAIEKEDLLQDDRFKTNSDRVINRKELINLLQKKFLENDTEYWLSVLSDKGIPFAPINNIKKTFEHPQVIARGMIQEVDHPKAGKIKLTGLNLYYEMVAIGEGSEKKKIPFLY